MDAEAFLVAWFNRNASVAAYGEVPAEGDKPTMGFITVERTGGFPSRDGIDRPMVAVQCWAQTRAKAAALAAEVALYADEICEDTRVAECSVSSLYLHPTAKKEPRYQVVFNLSLYI